MEQPTQRVVALPQPINEPPNLNQKAQSIVTLLAFGMVCASVTLYALQQLSHSATTLQIANPHYTTLLTLSALGLLGLTGLALWQMIRLAKRFVAQRSGARLSLMLSLSLFVAALIPIALITRFSWQYLSYNLEQTFNTHVNSTLDNALTLTRNTISLQSQQALNTSRHISNLISDMNHEALWLSIESLRRESGASALAVFDANGVLLAFAHQNLDIINTTAPSAAAISRVNETLEHISYSQENGQYQINVLLYLDKFGYNPYYLQSTFPMPLAFNHLVNEIEQGVKQHRSYGFLYPHIRANLLFILALVLTLSVLISAYLSLTLAQYLSRPIQQLIDATKQISSGDYNIYLSALPQNELGDLVRHFNQMSQNLHEAHASNHAIQLALSQEQSYLQSIMDNLSAGIIVLNDQHQLERHNQHAAELLNIEQKEDFHHTARLNDLLQQLDKALCDPKPNHQQEITLSQHGMRQVLMCHLSRLAHGHLLVFNDITEYHHNQRHAAWEEVARRLAHEIKNPLTPIQLQTERLQRKLFEALPEAERQILTRATDIIINQVKAMQHLVDEFSQIAKPLQLRRETFDFSELLREIAELYATQSALQLNLPPQPLHIHADRNQLRQVLHNVLKNAVEASSEASGGSQILIHAQPDKQWLTLSIEDNGAGFPNLSKDPFEPYVTHKEKGTGLGLAIVKKIIHEHGGSIHAGHSDTLGGACVQFTLPLGATT